MTLERKRKIFTISLLLVAFIILTLVNNYVKPIPSYTKTGKIIDKLKYFDGQDGKKVTYRFKLEMQYGNDEFNTLETVPRMVYDGAFVGKQINITIPEDNNKLHVLNIILVSLTICLLGCIWFGFIIDYFDKDK